MDHVQSLLLHHFQLRWMAENSLEPMDPQLLTLAISFDQNEFLTRSITSEEKEEVVRSMQSDKAPGLDGFPAFFLPAILTCLQT